MYGLCSRVSQPARAVMVMIMRYTSTVVFVFGMVTIIHAQKQSFEDYMQESNGQMTPKDPLLVRGGTLTLNCTIRDAYRGLYNASALTFRCAGKPIADSLVRVIDERLAEATVYEKDMEQMLCVCALPDVGIIAKQYVRLPTVPGRVDAVGPVITPELGECVVYNWQRLTCSWTPTEVQVAHMQGDKVDNSVTMHLYWTLVFLGNETQWFECSHTDGHSCTWSSTDFHTDTVYYMYIILKSQNFGMHESKLYTVNTTKIVKPDPVSELKAEFNNGTSLMLSWRRKFASPFIIVHLAYDLENGHNGTVHEQWTDISTAQVQRRHIAVRPYSYYNIRLRIKPVVAGFWSDTTTIRVKTAATVPVTNPAVSRSGFEIDGTCERGRRKVVIHWQGFPRSLWNSSWFGYELRFGSIDLDKPELKDSAGQRVFKNVTVNGDDTQEEICCDQNSAIGVRVSSVNSEGRSLIAHKLVIIPQHRNVLPVVRDFVATYQKDGHMRLTWQRDETKSSCDLFYTVFWCVGSQGYCKQSLQWHDVIGDDSFYDVKLPRDVHFKTYQFGISVNSLDSTSGIHWADCLYTIDGIADAPNNVHFSEHQEVSSLTVEWEMPRCKQQRGYITGFRILFCATRNSENCTGEMQVVEVPRQSGTNHYTLRHLSSQLLYRVQMQSVTHADTTSYFTSHPICQRPMKPIFTSSVNITIAVCVIIPAIFFVIGILTLVLRCKRLRQWYVKGLEIQMPERKTSCHMSTASDQPLTGYEKRPYRKQVSYSVRSADSGTGSLEDAITPPPSDNDAQYYVTTSSPPVSSSLPLMPISKMTLCEEDGEDDVFIGSPETSGGGHVKPDAWSCLVDGYTLASQVEPQTEFAAAQSGNDANRQSSACDEYVRVGIPDDFVLPAADENNSCLEASTACSTNPPVTSTINGYVPINVFPNQRL